MAMRSVVVIMMIVNMAVKMVMMMFVRHGMAKLAQTLVEQDSANGDDRQTRNRFQYPNDLVRNNRLRQQQLCQAQ